MKTIKQIGINALTKLYYKKNDPKSNFYQTILIGEEIDLNMSPKPFKNSTMGYSSGGYLIVWSIYLGIRILSDKHETLGEAIIDLDYVPSHVVQFRWTSCNDRQKEEYIIYRLTPDQENKLVKRLS